MKIEITWSDGKKEKVELENSLYDKLGSAITNALSWSNVSLSGGDKFYNLHFARKIEILEK